MWYHAVMNHLIQQRVVELEKQIVWISESVKTMGTLLSDMAEANRKTLTLLQALSIIAKGGE